MEYDCSGNEKREHIKYQGISRANGRSTCDIECPFCGITIKAYIWSLAGGGKRCDCGVMHTSFNVTRDDKNIYGGRNIKKAYRRRTK